MKRKWCDGFSMLANLGILSLANVLLAMATYFNQAVTLWRAFGVSEIKCRLCRLYCLQFAVKK